MVLGYLAPKYTRLDCSRMNKSSSASNYKPSTLLYMLKIILSLCSTKSIIYSAIFSLPR